MKYVFDLKVTIDCVGQAGPDYHRALQAAREELAGKLDRVEFTVDTLGASASMYATDPRGDGSRGQSEAALIAKQRAELTEREAELVSLRQACAELRARLEDVTKAAPTDHHRGRSMSKPLRSPRRRRHR